MTAFEHEFSMPRLEIIIRKEIVPKLEFIAGEQPAHISLFLIKHCKLLKSSKDQHLEESNSFEDGRLFYLHKGIARSYHYIALNDKLNVSRIWIKNDVIFDLNSYLNKSDRVDALQMLEEGEVLYISYGNLKTFVELYPNMIFLLLWIQIEQEKRCFFYHTFLNLNVDERVKIFLDRHPGIMPRINNDYIAAHLGINRSSLSIAYQAYKQDLDEADS